MEQAVNIPILVGSGVTEDNVFEYLGTNGIVIGSHLKIHGMWHQDLDGVRVNHFMESVRRYRELRKEEPEREIQRTGGKEYPWNRSLDTQGE